MTESLSAVRQGLEGDLRGCLTAEVKLLYLEIDRRQGQLESAVDRFVRPMHRTLVQFDAVDHNNGRFHWLCRWRALRYRKSPLIAFIAAKPLKVHYAILAPAHVKRQAIEPDLRNLRLDRYGKRLETGDVDG